MNQVDSYEFGRIVINGEEYRNDIIVLRDELITDWWRKESHSLHPEDLEQLLERDFNVLVVGTGNSGRMKVPDKVLEFLEEKGIEIVVLETSKAVKEFNILLKNNENPAGAFHLTC